MSDIILLAGQSDARVSLFQAALKNNLLEPAKVITYGEVASFSKDSDAIGKSSSSTIIRIDSSGRDVQALRHILEKGALALEEAGHFYIPKQEIAKMLVERGRLVPSHQYFAGLSALIYQFRAHIDSLAISASYMNSIDDSFLMMDKVACHAYLGKHNIPIARSLKKPVTNYDELREQMTQQGLLRVFVKLRHGAGAAGIVALETSGKRTQMRTTVECVKTAKGLVLYNTRQIKKSQDEAAIKALINELCKMDVHVEQWIPKAQVDGKSVDLRILVIGGKVCHQVLRMSHSPITNLHLLNDRSDVMPLKQKMTKSAWQDLLDTCINVAKLFPRCSYVALDVAVEIGLKRHVVLEVNAFGDFVKDVYHQGLTPYESEIHYLKSSGQLG